MEFEESQWDVVPQAAWHAHPLLAGLRAASTMFGGGRCFWAPAATPWQGAALRAIVLQALVDGEWIAIKADTGRAFYSGEEPGGTTRTVSWYREDGASEYRALVPR